MAMSWQNERRSSAGSKARLALIMLVAVASGICAATDSAVSPQGTAFVLTIRGAIGPATSDFFVRTVKHAGDRHAVALIVELDTPGGLDTAMREMIQAILSSTVPVLIYVSPSGARAASAGTYLLYASHVAAMAPATSVGAATPVNIGPPQKTPNSEKAPNADSQPKDERTDMERKVINDAVSYIRALAELRGRNADWAESAVRTAASLSATQALGEKVVDLIAKDIPDLLQQVDGRKVSITGREVTLHTAHVMLERIETDWRTQFLAVITDPNIAYLLFLIGLFGLMIEGYNPGVVLPGVVGAISLLLALFAFQTLPVNYAGLALIALGVVLMIAEAFMPSFGSLGVGGVIAFVFGSIILMDTEAPGFAVAWQLIGAIALVGALILVTGMVLLARTRRRSIATGREQMLNEPALAITDFEREGVVRAHGELWQAISSAPVYAGQRLRVVKVDGLTLQVEPDSTQTSTQSR
jgi:membrane-bound serine protease (ClpP class)